MKTAEQYAHKAKKVDLTLISANANEAEARVLEVGDSKYARRDYLRQENYDQEAMRALLRHVAEVMKGNQYDEETGQHHLAHIRANTGIILECWATHKTEPGVNWPHVPAKPKLGNPPGWVAGDGVQTNPETGKLITKGAVVPPNAYSREGSLSPYEPRKAPLMVPQSRDCTS